MELLLKRLSEIVSQEIVQYGKLLDILSIERRTLVGNSVERINEILKQQETLVLELRALEEARVSVMNKLSKLFPTKGQRLSLMELASQVEEPFASTYSQFSHRFSALLQQLEQINQDNAYLIDRSLDSINNSLRLFAAADLFGTGYSDQKKVKPQPGKRLCKAV